ncbi:MAG: enoyl-ACP reductase FabV [Sarcina sp.]
MIVKPKFRGFICTTAHPQGCKENVRKQVDYVENKGKIKELKNVLVLGSSTGYGLASAIVAGVGCDAKVLGVSFEKEATEKRTASPGWYNTEALKGFFEKKDLEYIKVNGDAFSNEVKDEVISLIKEKMGKVDLVIYSLAAPKRKDPNTGELYSSCLKTIGEPFTCKTVDFHTGEVMDATMPVATEEEIQGTIKVMGGEDWTMWMEALVKADVLSQDAKTVAYSYIGPRVTDPIYREGTIGSAKKDLENSVGKIDDILKVVNGKSYVSINKALVTQASSAIPIVPLYSALLYKLMKEEGTHEGCIEQIYRLFEELYGKANLNLDEDGRIRLDDYEMAPHLQAKVIEIWEEIETSNVYQLTDLEEMRNEFFRLFGFNVDGIDYEADVNITTVD